MRPILFLTDYGLRDEFVGVCHAVMAAAAPGVRVIDLSHGVPPQDVRRGALALLAAAPYAPGDAVYLAVVDPGVGTERAAVAVAAGDALLVGPDNGLLSMAWEALGGADRAVAIDAPAAASATFHGRDVFAPSAARLAAGASIEELGSAVDPASLLRLPVPRPRPAAGGVEAEVIGVDRFGNVQLGARPGDVPAGLGDVVRVGAAGSAVPCRRVRTFAEVPPGEVAVLVDSAGWLALVAPGGSAAGILGLRPGEEVLLSLPPWDSAS
ncbi:MAG TPA: SAM-dependent chlorinase/fluorinase [Actinomycetota bacterium]|nr:SAM-dependent chlorinase/fluorinase [Actinomycetota bacterium]